METARVWDEIVESARSQTASAESSKRRCGLATLPLSPKRNPRHFPNIARSVAEIHQSLRTVIRSLVSGESPWPLFLHGPAGTGKTCAALCLLDHVLIGGKTPPTQYFTVSALCAALIESQLGRMENAVGAKVWPAEFWQRIYAAPLFVLDEIGARETVSDAHYDAVKSAIDSRAGKPFVAISNLPMARVEALYDARIASRLSAGTVIELGGADRRI